MGSRGGLTGWFRKRYDRGRRQRRDGADRRARARRDRRARHPRRRRIRVRPASRCRTCAARPTSRCTANRVTTAALRLERVVDELDQSLRGFVLTRNRAHPRELGGSQPLAAPGDRRAGEAVGLPTPRGAARAHDRSGPGAGVRHRLRQPDAPDRRGGPGGCAVADDDARGPVSGSASSDAIWPDCSRDEDRLVSSHASSSRHRASQAVLIGGIALATSGLPAPARQRLPRARRRASGARRRERRLPDRRRRPLDAHPGRPARPRSAS